MSTERRLLLAIVVCVLAIGLLEWALPQPVPPPRKPTPPAEARVDPAVASAESPPAADGGGAAAPPAPAADGAPAADEGRKRVQDPPPFDTFDLASGRLRTRVRSRGGCLDGVTLAGVLEKPKTDPADPARWLRFLEPSPNTLPGALGVTLLSRDRTLRDLEAVHWRLVSAPGAVPVVLETRALPTEREGLGITVTVTLQPEPGPDAWHLTQRVAVRNDDPDLAGIEMRLQVRGAALHHEPVAEARDALAGWAKIRNTGLKSTNGASVAAAAKKKEPVRHAGDVQWAGSGSTYFAAIVSPVEAEGAGGTPSPVAEVQWSALEPPHDPRVPGRPEASPLLLVPGRMPAPGAEVVHEFHFFVGPKSNEVLEREEYAHLLPIQDRLFGFIATPLFLILSAVHAVVPNWGVGIILLTLLVRGLLFPLSRRQLKSTIEYGEKMKRFKPKLDALKEKYKGNSKKIQQEQLRMMKEENIPLMPGGCLLTVLQIPIWIALYGMLQTNYSLRHAPFLWVDDLSQADHLWRMLPDAASMPFVPTALEYLNLLPLIMTFTWFFASKATMTPPADEQQAQMQKMMQWMPFIMLLFPGFYTMPAGLCLYITVSSIWGIIESRYIRRSLGVA